MAYENDMNLKATELRLGLPGTHIIEDVIDESSSTITTTTTINKKRLSTNIIINNKSDDININNNDQQEKQDQDEDQEEDQEIAPPPAKAQIVGWPPVRGYRKNTMMMMMSQQKKIISPKNNNINSETEIIINGMFVKVSMDGAPYLRKIDLRVYKNYTELLKALEAMFKFTVGEYSEREGYKGSDYVPTYEDKDGDWMLVGDVPWNMFMSSCKRMRIMRESEARGLGCGV